MKYLKSATTLQHDDRGWVLFPITDQELLGGSFKNFHLASIDPGEIRGNHYHRFKTEYIFIFGGKVSVTIQDLNVGEEIHHEEIECKSPVLLEVKPMVVHTIKNISESVVNLFCYGTESYDEKNPDVIKKVILT